MKTIVIDSLSAEATLYTHAEVIARAALRGFFGGEGFSNMSLPARKAATKAVVEVLRGERTRNAGADGKCSDCHQLLKVEKCIRCGEGSCSVCNQPNGVCWKCREDVERGLYEDGEYEKVLAEEARRRENQEDK